MPSMAGFSSSGGGYGSDSRNGNGSSSFVRLGSRAAADLGSPTSGRNTAGATTTYTPRIHSELPPRSSAASSAQSPTPRTYATVSMGGTPRMSPGRSHTADSGPKHSPGPGEGRGLRPGSDPGRGQAGEKQAAAGRPDSSKERMYSAKQLSEALKSGLAAVKEQLQVLAILDGTAMSWPGVSQSVDDVEFLTDMVVQVINRLETGFQSLQAQLSDSQAEIATLRESLAVATSRRDELQRLLNGANREAREVRGQLEDARRELQQVREEVWTLEKQRADTASELDRARQDLDELQEEMRTLRETSSEQTSTISSLKEELAARRSDVGHLKQLAGELRASNDHLRKQLAGAQEAAAAAQGTLQHVRSEKQHYEREVGRLGEECSRLAVELERTSREATRLREWQDVIKKVEADKLREEQGAHSRSRCEAELRAAEADKKEALLRAEVRAREDRLAGRDAELDTQKKANGLLQLQVKDLQKQLALSQGERAAAANARDDQRAMVAKLQGEVQRMRLEWAQRDKERTVAESATKETAAADKARMQAKLDEAVREAQLARTLSEGWQRELRETKAKAAAMAKELEAARSQLSEGKMDQVRSGAAAESQVAVLRATLAAKDEEVRRVKLDAASVQKQLEKVIERLQREVDASAAEVARLKAGEDVLFTRLPPVARAATIHEELEALRKALRDRTAGPPPAPQSTSRSGSGAGGGPASPGRALQDPQPHPHDPHPHHQHHRSHQHHHQHLASVPALPLPPSSALPVLTGGNGTAAPGAPPGPVGERQPRLRNRTR